MWMSPPASQRPQLLGRRRLLMYANQRKLPKPQENIMNTRTLLIIIIILLVLGGGGYYGQGRWF